MTHELARIPTDTNSRRLVWVVRCVICRGWMKLGPSSTPRVEIETRLGDKPDVHADCRDRPSATTPTIDGLEI